MFYACRGHFSTSAKNPSSNYSVEYLLGNESTEETQSTEYSVDYPSMTHPPLGYPGVPEINQMATPPHLYGSQPQGHSGPDQSCSLTTFRGSF